MPARHTARNSPKMTLWPASILNSSPGLVGFLQGFLRSSCGVLADFLSKPTLSQPFPGKELHNCQKHVKYQQTPLFFSYSGWSQTLSQLFPRTAGKELGKSWERVGKEPTRPLPFPRFWAIFLIPCKGSCGLSCSVPCRRTLSQFFPRGP